MAMIDSICSENRNAATSLAPADGRNFWRCTNVAYDYARIPIKHQTKDNFDCQSRQLKIKRLTQLTISATHQDADFSRIYIYDLRSTVNSRRHWQQ
ncbi:hypothetical protein D3C78_856690 [compost metagenome]